MSYAMMLDTPIFKKLTKDSVYIDNFNESVDNNNVLSSINNNTVIHYSSFFSIIEAIGLVVPKFSITIDEVLSNLNIPINKKNSLSLEEVDLVFFYILKLVRQFYFNHHLLSQEFLEEKYRIQLRDFTSPEGLEVFYKYIDPHLLRPDYRNYLIDTIVYNFFMRLNLTKEIDDLIYFKFLLPTLFFNNDNYLQSSKFRLASRIWYRVLDLDRQEKKIFTEETKNLILKGIKIKPSRDFLDCDLIHFLTIGLSLSGNIHPVLVFTEENIDVITTRIQLYRRIISELKFNPQNSFADKSTVFNTSNNKEGIIAFLNEDGTLKSLISVEDIEKIP